MKDALGHGSNNRGVHAQGTQATPQLQRRHFEAIAAELKAKNASSDEVSAMADKLATTNPGFRRDFFVKAATGGDYRFKGPGKNAAAVAKRASKFSKADLQASIERGHAMRSAGDGGHVPGFKR